MRYWSSAILFALLLGIAQVLAACTPDTLRLVPLDRSWQVETYGADKDSALGARGLSAAKPAARELELTVDFASNDVNKTQGEVLRLLDDIPGCGRLTDFSGAVISVKLVTPPELARLRNGQGVAGAQIILETESIDGIPSRQYSGWTDLENGAQTITMIPTALTLIKDGHTDPGLDLERTVKVGIKVALNSASQGTYHANLTVREVGIQFPTIQMREKIKAEVRKARRPISDNATLSMLPPLAAPDKNAQVLATTRDLVAKSPAVRSISVRSEPRNQSNSVWEIMVRFDEYRPHAAERSARVSYRVPEPLDLTNKKVTAFAAIGPALRGASLRPNQVQLELYDEEGNVLRGPAADVSVSGIAFGSDGRESASRWVKVEATHPGDNPLAMGYVSPRFRAAKVNEIVLRFQVGKFSHELRKNPYPLEGKLLLSPISVEDNPRALEPVMVATARPTVDRKPVPPEQFLVGINYPWINYGWDLGQAPFGSRTQCGFSSLQPKLERDFSKLHESGIKVVRVFLLGDLRAGVVYDKGKMPVGLDLCVAKDLAALTEAASKCGVQLMPVLIDFLIGDGTLDREYGAKRWKEGEAPHFLIESEPRRAFIENVLRPIIRQLNQAKQVIYAVDIANEIENAPAVAAHFSEVMVFVRQVRELIRQEAPEVKVTLGSRDRDDLVRHWAETGWDVAQCHYYDKMAEEEDRSLDFPAGKLGLTEPVIVGEVEPSDIPGKLETIWKNGYSAAFFWSFRGTDGYVVDQDAIRAWLDGKKSGNAR